MKSETMKIPLEALLKYANKKLQQKDEEIAGLKVTIGCLESYIAELEDAEEREARILKRKEKSMDEDWIAIRQEVKNQRNIIGSQKNTIDNLMAKLNKYDLDRN